MTSPPAAEPDGWFILFWGAADWETVVADAIAPIRPADAAAHHVLFREADGSRWGLLLLGWSRMETDFLLGQLGAFWDDHIVTAITADGPSA